MAQAPVGAEFQVNTYTPRAQLHPSVAVAPSGNFVVVWGSRQDGSFYGVYAQRFDATGAPIGAEFLVNTHTTGSQNSPDVACDASGGFARS